MSIDHGENSRGREGDHVRLAGYLALLRRRWVTVAIVALATVAAAAIVTLAMPTRYTATTRLFFGVQSGESATDLSQGSTFAEKQMTSYAQVAVSPLVLQPVIADLALSTTPRDLARSMSATVPTDTVILDIAFTDGDPAQAARVSNAIGVKLSSVVAGLSPPRPNGDDSVRATILAPAVVPVEPSSPRVLRNLALGVVLGLLLGLAAGLIRDALDSKLRTEDDVRATTDVPLLGTIPFDASTSLHRLAMSDHETGGRAEAVRRLRTNLQFLGQGGHPGVVVTSSSVPGEGKTTTAINLSAALADAGMNVLLIDADLRRPSVADYLGVEGQAGLTSVLIGRADLSDVTQRLGHRSLDVLAAGPIPPNPSELLGSSAMRDLVAQAREAYDIVIIDSPPLLAVTDPAVLSRLADGALIVVGADRTHRQQLVGSLDTLHGVDGHIFGLVLNKVARRDASAYGRQYGYTSSSEVSTEPSGHHATAEAQHSEVSGGSSRGTVDIADGKAAELPKAVLERTYATTDRDAVTR